MAVAKPKHILDVIWQSIYAVLAGKEPPKIGPWRLTRDILREDGVQGLFRGLTATFTREMPGYFFFFLAYEATRQVLPCFYLLACTKPSRR